MAPEQCPECGLRVVYYGSDPLRRAVRAVFGSRKRYCPSCRHRWHVPGRPQLPRLQAAGLALALGLITLLLCFSIASTPWGRTHHLPTALSVATLIHGAVFSPQDRGDGYSSKRGGFFGAQTPSDHDILHPVSGAGHGDSPPEVLAGLRPGHQEQSQGFDFMGLFKDSGDLMRLALKSGDKKAQMDDLEHLSKKELWDKYGSYFQSKEQAKAAYDQYQQKKKSGELDDKFPPPAPEPQENPE